MGFWDGSGYLDRAVGTDSADHVQGGLKCQLACGTQTLTTVARLGMCLTEFSTSSSVTSISTQQLSSSGGRGSAPCLVTHGCTWTRARGEKEVVRSHSASRDTLSLRTQVFSRRLLTGKSELVERLQSVAAHQALRRHTAASETVTETSSRRNGFIKDASSQFHARIRYCGLSNTTSLTHGMLFQQGSQ